MICICLSTSTSRSAAWTTRSTPRRVAASCAPFCMSMKKGLFSVLSTRATRGLAGAAESGAGLLQPARASPARTVTEHAGRAIFMVSSPRSLEHRVHQNGHDDDAADGEGPFGGTHEILHLTAT